MDVIHIPTNRPIIRKDLNDSVYSIEEISIKYEQNNLEIWVYTKFHELIKNIPN